MKRLFLALVVVFAASCDKGVPEEETPDPTAEIWWNNHVFYEIFVRSFYDSNADGIGDLRGIIEKLDYLNDGNPSTDTDLGVTGIWLMPIHPSPSYHGYDVTDYMAVNPQYGTMNDFTELVDKCHARGIKVIIDFVANHSSEQHPWFTASASSPSSDKRQYYVWSNAPRNNSWVAKNGSYYYAYFWSGMPDLNYVSNDVTEEIYTAAKHWDEVGNVDGFRMDAIPYLIEETTNIQHTPSTLKWLRNFWIEQKQRNPSFMLVGEVWFSTTDVVQYTDKRMDYCFEFDLGGAIINAALNGDVLPLKSKINQVITAYPERQYGVFLSNHDQNRIIETLSLNVSKAKVAAAIMLTLPGVPYLYYGEEVGMRGVKPDEDIRRPMQWTAGANAGFTTATPWRSPNADFTTANVATLRQDPNSIWNHYRKLIKIRNTQLPLQQGTYFPVDATVQAIYSYMLLKGNDAVIAIHNMSGSLAQPTFSATTGMQPGSYKATDLLTGSVLGTITVSTGGKLENVSLGEFAAYSSRIVTLTP